MEANRSSLSESYLRFVWSNVSDALNIGLTGKKAKHWREFLGCKNNELRDYWTANHLNKIEHLEKYAEKLVTKKGIEPHEAMKAALDFYEFEILDKSEFIRS